MYIYHIAIAVEGAENLVLEYELDKCVTEYLQDKGAELVSTQSEELFGKNYGRCIKCGCWTSDATQKERILSFSNGAKVGSNWYCDLCLPANHPNSF